MEWGDDGKAAPMLVMQQERQGRDLGGVVMRSFMSLALLMVMLLAFGAAIAAWNKKTELDALLKREEKSISAEAAAVVLYRDQLANITESIKVENKPYAAPEPPTWQRQIDVLVRENNDLRWAMQQLRQAKAEQEVAKKRRRNPAEPGTPAPP